MKEEVSDLIKYNDVVIEIREMVGKKYMTSNSKHRWITIYKRTLLNFFSNPISVAKIYPIDKDDNEEGEIEVSDPKLYDIFKKYGEEKGYPVIKRNFPVSVEEW